MIQVKRQIKVDNKPSTLVKALIIDFFIIYKRSLTLTSNSPKTLHYEAFCNVEFAKSLYLSIA